MDAPDRLPLYTRCRMKRGRCYSTILALTPWLLLAAGGCENAQARRYLRQRDEHLRQTVRDFQDREDASRPNLRNITTGIKTQHETDVRKFADDRRRLKEDIEAEFQQWRDRQDAYREAIEEKLRGDPERIEDTWPKVVF